MIKLRTALLCDKLYYILLISVLIIITIYITIPKKSNYIGTENKITGTITNIYIDGNYLKLNIIGQDKLISSYYFKTKEELTNFKKIFSLGDKIYLEGKLNIPQKNKIENLFDYKTYLKHKKIYYLFEIKSYRKIANNKNIYYRFKQKIINRIDKNPYLYLFLLGDKNYLQNDVMTSYQNNGISHLFAISGMHINLLGSILLKILKKLKLNETKRYLSTSLFLLFYAILTGLSASVVRGVLFFVLFSINKIFYFYIKNTNIFIVTLVISLLINPYFIYDVGFLYSFSISFTLLVMSDVINKYKNYFLKLFITSILSFTISLPITIYYFYQINFLSIIYNLFYVPFVSIILFPLSLLTFILKPLLPLYNILTMILEKTSIFFNKITIFTFIFPKTYKMIYIIYFIFIILLFLGLKNRKKLFFIPITILLIIHYIYPFFDTNVYINMIDVGQGDSILLHIHNKNILIDTGGKKFYERCKWQKRKDVYSITNTTTTPLLKSLGIKKIDYLILTHGDYDHIGEAINLVENYKVENVIFNCGEYNDLEKELIEVLEEKNINYYSCIKELNIDKYKLQFLNTGVYDNENDNSSVIYLNYNNYKCLFMGDASTTREKDILEKYNLSNIDFIKIGHHGSNTSSSEEFINSINPKYSLISVGTNNRYGHPKESVLDILSNTKIYRTDIDGSIEIKLNKSGYKIRTCPP